MSSQIISPVTAKPATTFFAEGASQFGDELAAAFHAFVGKFRWPHGKKALQVAQAAIVLHFRTCRAIGSIQAVRAVERRLWGGYLASCWRHGPALGCLRMPEHCTQPGARGLFRSRCPAAGSPIHQGAG